MATVITGLACGSLVWMSCAGPTLTMRSDAMAPAIRSGAVMSLDTAAYSRRNPERFDIILFVYEPATGIQRVQEPPRGAEISYRVVGLPGEAVEVTREGVRVNGSLLRMPRGLDYQPAPESAEFTRFNRVLLPEDAYYVLGDNSEVALDSRYWGWVPRKNIVGKIQLADE